MRSSSEIVPKPLRALLRALAVAVAVLLLAYGVMMTAWLAPMG